MEGVEEAEGTELRPSPGLPSMTRPSPWHHPELGVTAPALQEGQSGLSGPDPQHGALQATEPRLLWFCSVTTRPLRPLSKTE